MSYISLYRQAIAAGWTAERATEWAGAMHALEEREDVRLRTEPDTCWDYEDLAGDTYNPEVNDDIPAERLAREEREFRNRIDREGVYGLVAERKCPACGQWETVDSVWGFVGDDWEMSGYDEDLALAAMAA